MQSYLGRRDGLKRLREQVTKRNTGRKVKNGLQRFDLLCEIATRTNKRRKCAIQKHAKFGLDTLLVRRTLGNIDHFEQQKLVVKWDDGITYQAGEHLERQKEQSTETYKTATSKTKLLPTRKKFIVCKIVQKGDCTALQDYEKVPAVLPGTKKRNGVKVLDVKSVKHKGQKRKLLIAENETVCKVKRSKLENNVEARQYV